MSNLDSDIVKAQEIVSCKTSNLKDNCFHNNSCIYKFTNEDISSYLYTSLLKNKKKILSVIASGDHIINSILLGCKDIDCYDISIFPKYFLKLKMAALKSLDYQEFIKFFAGSIHEEFNIEKYDLIAENLSDNDRKFWDSLFDFFDGEEIYSSTLFSSEAFSKNGAIANNPYLKKDNFERVKEMIDDVKINCYDGDIFMLVDRLSDKYDLINLSNICYYIEGENKMLSYRKFLEKLPLDKNGCAISYIFSFANCPLEEVEEHLSSDNIYSVPLSFEKSNSGLILSKRR